MLLRKRDVTPDPVSGLPAQDMSFGHGTADYWHDAPDGVAQLVLERMSLWRADWFLDTSDGMPWRNEVLGKYTDASRDRAIRARVLATEGVTGITEYGSQLNRDTRKVATQVTLKTAYGSVTVPIGSTTADVRLAR